MGTATIDNEDRAVRRVFAATVLPDGVRLAVRPDETIEAAVYRAGFAHRRGCRRGGCGICVADLVSGQIRYERPVAESVVSSEDRAAGAILVCRAVPTTDVVVRLRDESLRCVSPLLHQLAARELDEHGKEES